MKVSFWQDPQFYRKQTYLLLFALVLSVVFAYSPVFIIKSGDANWAEVSGGQVLIHQSQAAISEIWWPKVLFPVVVIAILAIAVAIFSFANRKQQIQIARICFLTQIVCLTLPYLISNYVVGKFSNSSQVLVMTFSYGLILPILNLLLIAFSIKLVQQDIKRLKSMDRLR